MRERNGSLAVFYRTGAVDFGFWIDFGELSRAADFGLKMPVVFFPPIQNPKSAIQNGVHASRAAG
jgi:hypothetical protein